MKLQGEDGAGRLELHVMSSLALRNVSCCKQRRCGNFPQSC